MCLFNNFCIFLINLLTYFSSISRKNEIRRRDLNQIENKTESVQQHDDDHMPETQPRQINATYLINNKKVKWYN